MRRSGGEAIRESIRREADRARQTPADQARANVAETGAASIGGCDTVTGEFVLVSLLDRDSFGEQLGAPTDGWVLG